MASAEREPITGVWGRSPQQSPGAEPMIRGSGAKPPEAESLLTKQHRNLRLKFGLLQV